MTKKSPYPLAIRREALRLARMDVRQALRAHGVRLACVKSQDITRAARELLDNDPFYYTKATADCTT